MLLGDFSIICFEFLGDFWRKSQKYAKKKENGNLGKTGPFAAAKGTLAAAKLKGQKGLPSGSPRRSPATSKRSHCS